ncbi:hypothetical protein AVEN_264795-1 [Araneus ventricosus]|uniref:Uncharacterized protein n=1 Tax=Araneus ventricosus TaxID=182803 RepID=A0A4Y2TXA0_ARAVE|nr:hypothetical protein AVEN_264795-1 [Araneus ventricosus]
MYVKLVEIGTLLGKKNPYVYRTQLKHLAVQGMDVLPQAGYDIPQKTLIVHVVPIVLAYRLLMEENIELGQLLLKRLSEGFAHKHGMRKFVINERKSPLLVCVDEKDDKCVSVHKWIDEFTRDLELHREEVQKHSVLSPSAALEGKCVQTFLRCEKTRTDESGNESTSGFSTEHSLDVKLDDFFVRHELSMDPTPNIKLEPQESSIMEAIPSGELEPREFSIPDPTPESPEEPTPESPVEPTPESPVEPTPESPVEPTPESPEEPTTSARKIHPIPVAFVDLSKISFVPTMGIFPEPGD